MRKTSAMPLYLLRVGNWISGRKFMESYSLTVNQVFFFFLYCKTSHITRKRVHFKNKKYSSRNQVANKRVVISLWILLQALRVMNNFNEIKRRTRVVDIIMAINQEDLITRLRRAPLFGELYGYNARLSLR